VKKCFCVYGIIIMICIFKLIIVITWLCTFFSLSNTEIVGSNPTQGIEYVRFFSVFVLSSVGRGCAADQSSVQGILLNVSKQDSKTPKMIGLDLFGL
jgi:hypothetical protein